MIARVFAFVALVVLLTLARSARAQDAPQPPAAQPTPAPEDKKNEARVLFESGVAHFDRAEWSAALADFVRSRELFPTRAATKNAAVCLRREGRFDESLEMFETLLREFADLAPGDRAFAEKEISELRGAVCTIEIEAAEPGATIVVDGRTRGTYPTPAPLRVAAGSHLVRIYKEGFAPFERRVDVAGRQSVAVEARLAALTQAGRLSVTETGGRALDVVVDNVVVGKTPWSAALPVGSHTISLRGEGDLGTQPATASVRLGELTALSLAAESLASSLRVTPVPAGATVSIDGVVVGEGVWEGRLREGAHDVEVAGEGFLPSRSRVTLTRDKREAITVTLERDPTSPLWRARHPPRVYLELLGGPAIGLAYGGDIRSSCSGDCSAAIPFGYALTVHGGYETASGVTLGLDAGYMLVSAGVTARATDLAPRGLPVDSGTVDHDLAIRGFRVGPSAGLRFGEDLPITLRLGAGVFFGSAVDVRHGTFKTSGGAPFDVDVSEAPAMTALYLAPEARIAKRFPSRFEVGAGVAFMVLAALDRPQWKDQQPVLAAPPGQQGDGVATFGSQTLTGALLFVAVPSVDVRYAF